MAASIDNSINNRKNPWIIRDVFRTQSNIYKMDFFAKKLDCIQSLTILAKSSILGVSESYKYASDEACFKNSNLLPVQTHCNSFRLILSNFFGECKDIEIKLQSIVPTLLQ